MLTALMSLGQCSSCCHDKSLHVKLTTRHEREMAATHINLLRRYYKLLLLYFYRL